MKLLLGNLPTIGLWSAIASPPAIAQETPRYPQDYRQAYIDSCASGRERIRTNCECIVKKSEEKYSWQQFQEINRQLQTRGILPSEFIQIVATCKQNPQQ